MEALQLRLIMTRPAGVEIYFFLKKTRQLVTIKGNSGAPLSPPSPPPLSPSLTPPSFSHFRPFPHSHILLLLLAKLHDLHEYWTYIAITMEHYFFASLTKQREDWTYKFIDELVKNQKQSNQSMNWTEFGCLIDFLKFPAKRKTRTTWKWKIYSSRKRLINQLINQQK